MITIGTRPPKIKQANKRGNRFLLSTMACMFLYGIFLPVSWEDRFGPFGEFITWTALTVPAAVKLAEVSPIPELVSGFVGLGAWVAPAFALLFVSKDPIGERVRFAFSRPGWPFLKTFGFLYLLACPAIMIGIWVAYCMPITIDMTGGFTWGGKLLVSMITDRFSLAFFGAIFTAGIGLLFWILIAYVVGPIVLMLNGD